MNSFYPPSTPRTVEGGIVARSKRGPIAQHWWSQRFITVLEDMGLGSRLQRGRTYARKGQVVSLEIDAGSVTAQVQGSRPRPYRVRIGTGAFGKSQWAEVEQALAANAWYLANLLAGEMPDEIEDVFTGVGLSLFPTSASDLSLDCSCPDRVVPCKHLAAAFYLLAESFDEDPFQIFAWRGRQRTDLLDNLHAARTDSPRGTGDAQATSAPLESLLDSFFVLRGPLHRSRSSTHSRTSLLDQLPPVEIAIRGHTLPELLRPAFETAAASGDT
jgi:uncharacterized Zn finger protein